MYDFGSEVREAFFEMAIETGDKKYLRGAYSSFAEWRDLSDVADFFEQNEDVVLKAIDIVHKNTVYQRPYKNSVHVVRRLAYEENHIIKYVTSRHEKFYNDTELWLQSCAFPNGELICSTHDKRPHISDCQYIIDDRPKTLIEFITDFTWKLSHGSENKEKQRKAFGLWTPYNRNLTDVRNILLAPTWRGIEYYLERKGLLTK